jgi:hypothetical protein
MLRQFKTPDHEASAGYTLYPREFEKQIGGVTVQGHHEIYHTLALAQRRFSSILEVQAARADAATSRNA